jgi:hypothetical protein
MDDRAPRIDAERALSKKLALGLPQNDVKVAGVCFAPTVHGGAPSPGALSGADYSGGAEAPLLCVCRRRIRMFSTPRCSCGPPSTLAPAARSTRRSLGGRRSAWHYERCRRAPEHSPPDGRVWPCSCGPLRLARLVHKWKHPHVVRGDPRAHRLASDAPTEHARRVEGWQPNLSLNKISKIQCDGISVPSRIDVAKAVVFTLSIRYGQPNRGSRRSCESAIYDEFIDAIDGRPR